MVTPEVGLHHAAAIGDISTIQDYLEHTSNIDLNAKDEDGTL